MHEAIAALVNSRGTVLARTLCTKVAPRVLLILECMLALFSSTIVPVGPTAKHAPHCCCLQNFKSKCSEPQLGL